MMAIERDGPQVGPLNEAVVSQLNAAIAEARKVEGVRARLGGVSTQPNYTREGKPNGWRVRGDVVLESSRMPALAQLAGKLGERLQMSSVQFRLSRERRRSEEQSLLREAAQGFRDKALQTAQAFGYKGYEIKELVLQPGQGSMPRPMIMARSAPDMAAAAPPPPLPDEGGDSEVTVAVSGTVELTP
jgi:predicted secreted protein